MVKIIKFAHSRDKPKSLKLNTSLIFRVKVANVHDFLAVLLLQANSVVVENPTHTDVTIQILPLSLYPNPQVMVDMLMAGLVW